MPATDGILIDQVEQLHAVVAHHPGRGVGIRTALVQGHKIVVAILRAGLVPQDPRGYGELPMAGQGTEVQRPEPIRANGRQGHPKDSLLAPLEVDAGDVEVALRGSGKKYECAEKRQDLFSSQEYAIRP